jgi:oligopeptide/dipeptide ABC transporter ATP-binding protein
MTTPLLQVKDLRTWFDVEGNRAWAVGGVSFDVLPGEFLGIVGESGSGKSVTALSLMRLIPDPPGRIESGEVLFEGRDLLKLPLEEVRRVRGKDIAMIFQEPMTSLNPVLTIGRQVMESLRLHEDLDDAAARARAVEVLTQVGIPDAEKRLSAYPHQFSGGMRQRVMIAMALSCRPKLLIADEPTTALDVTIQAQILDLMQSLQQERQGGATILITHDLAVVAETCDRVIVMYGGRIQEIGSTRDLFRGPLHPYTRGLMGSIPGEGTKGKPLHAIPGNVPSILDFPPGCRFCSRCELVEERCRIEEPPLVEVAPGRQVRCHLVEPAPAAGAASADEGGAA